jgi:hypothetical protein
VRVPHRRDDCRKEIKADAEDHEVHRISRLRSDSSTQSLTPKFPNFAR